MIDRGGDWCQSEWEMTFAYGCLEDGRRVVSPRVGLIIRGRVAVHSTTRSEKTRARKRGRARASRQRECDAYTRGAASELRGCRGPSGAGNSLAAGASIKHGHRDL